MPEGNEEALIQMAKKLGHNKLIFACEKAPLLKTDFPHEIITFKRSQYRFIAKKAEDLEQGKVAYLTDIELEEKKDSFHERKSGFNHVYATLAKKHGTTVCLNLQLLHRPDREKTMGRMMQNVRLCKKCGVPVIVASFARNPYQMRSSKDLQALGRVLGVMNSEKTI